MREIMKKLSFAGPIHFTTILLFAAACGKNTAAETVPPQTQIASESDFSEETSEDAVPHILNVSVKGIRGTRMQQALNEKGICVSVKSACAVEGTPSKAVYAVCRDRNRAMNSFRISLSHLTTKKELDTFLQAFLECCKERE